MSLCKAIMSSHLDNYMQFQENLWKNDIESGKKRGGEFATRMTKGFNTSNTNTRIVLL